MKQHKTISMVSGALVLIGLAMCIVCELGSKASTMGSVILSLGLTIAVVFWISEDKND